MRVLMDMDGCIINICGAIQYRDSRFNPDSVVDYDFVQEVYGIPREEVYRYLNDVYTYEIAEPYEGAVEAIRKYSGIMQLEAYTNVAKHIVGVRSKQCRSVGLSLMHLFTGEKPYIECDFVIDDCPRVLDRFPVENRILIQRRYNMGYNDVCWKFCSVADALDYLGGIHDVYEYEKSLRSIRGSGRSI